jgi:hypothetical protein
LQGVQRDGHVPERRRQRVHGHGHVPRLRRHLLRAAPCVRAAISCDDNNPCTTDSCNNASGCVHTPLTGTACNDNNACTQTDACQNGTCTGGNPVTCNGASGCKLAGVCKAATGQCEYADAPDGTTCNDGNACTQTDKCNDGSCMGSNAVVCPAPDQCHVAGTCNPANGQCSNPPNTGANCDDNNACTQTDKCSAGGACVGSNAVVCTALDQCHVAGTCNPVNGQCNNPPNTGAGCDDGDKCTTTDKCSAGGTCMGSPVVCTALDQCHVAGTCNPASGQCNNPPNTGADCDDGDLCTTTDKCSAGGVCVGSDNVVCPNPAPCHNPGRATRAQACARTPSRSTALAVTTCSCALTTISARTASALARQSRAMRACCATRPRACAFRTSIAHRAEPSGREGASLCPRSGTACSRGSS